MAKSVRVRMSAADSACILSTLAVSRARRFFSPGCGSQYGCITVPAITLRGGRLDEFGRCTAAIRGAVPSAVRKDLRCMFNSVLLKALSLQSRNISRLARIAYVPDLLYWYEMRWTGLARTAGSCDYGLSAADWPEWRGTGRQGIWPETGIIERFRRWTEGAVACARSRRLFRPRCSWRTRVPARSFADTGSRVSERVVCLGRAHG